MSVEDDIAKSIDRLMTEDAEELFGSMATMVPEQNKNLSIEELMKTAELLETPAQAWKRDREDCIKGDREKGRGTLVLNPELEGVAGMRGNITEKAGVEYRVIIDEYLRGARDKDGGIRGGYWVDPLPKLVPVPPLPPTPPQDAISFGLRYGVTAPLSYPTIVGVVDDPVPAELFNMSKPPARVQKRSMVEFWRNTRADQIARGGEPWSFKVWARRCKAGRAWLARKKR